MFKSDVASEPLRATSSSSRCQARSGPGAWEPMLGPLLPLALWALPPGSRAQGSAGQRDTRTVHRPSKGPSAALSPECRCAPMALVRFRSGSSASAWHAVTQQLCSRWEHLCGLYLTVRSASVKGKSLFAQSSLTARHTGLSWESKLKRMPRAPSSHRWGPSTRGALLSQLRARAAASHLPLLSSWLSLSPVLSGQAAGSSDRH